MMIQQTLQTLAELKLHGMARALAGQLESSHCNDLCFEERVSLLVDNEKAYRDTVRLQRLVRQAKFKEFACIEDVDFRPGRGLSKSDIASIAMCDWIGRGHNLIVTGSTGVGKTWLACAIGHQACRHGLKVSFQRLPLLLEDLSIAHADGSFRQRLKALAKLDLLILDDLGVGTLNAQARNDLLEVIDQRSGLKSTMVTSQLPADTWHDYLSGGKVGGNVTVADSILDRILSNSIRLSPKGDSLRKNQGKASKK